LFVLLVCGWVGGGGTHTHPHTHTHTYAHTHIRMHAHLCTAHRLNFTHTTRTHTHTRTRTYSYDRTSKSSTDSDLSQAAAFHGIAADEDPTYAELPGATPAVTKRDKPLNNSTFVPPTHSPTHLGKACRVSTQIQCDISKNTSYIKTAHTLQHNHRLLA
jgi:hypothetical protein